MAPAGFLCADACCVASELQLASQAAAPFWPSSVAGGRTFRVPVVQAAQNVVPVAVTAGDKIETRRQWASGRCLSADRAGESGGWCGRV